MGRTADVALPGVAYAGATSPEREHTWHRWLRWNARRSTGSIWSLRSRGRGEPLVLIHGGIVGDAFAPVFREPALAARYHLIRYHRRGFGGSARPAGPVTTAEQAADCLGLMRYLGIERAHIAGYSYGGTIALQLALDVPRAIHTLALFEPFLPEGIADPAALEYLGKTG